MAREHNVDAIYRLVGFIHYDSQWLADTHVGTFIVGILEQSLTQG
jgi:hypothetical protein